VRSIYMARFMCRDIQPVALPGYNNVLLRLEGVEHSNSDVVIKGTLSRFIVGKEYLVMISDTNV